MAQPTVRHTDPPPLPWILAGTRYSLLGYYTASRPYSGFAISEYVSMMTVCVGTQGLKPDFLGPSPVS
jgi:hypothetical protein